MSYSLSMIFSSLVSECSVYDSDLLITVVCVTLHWPLPQGDATLSTVLHNNLYFLWNV